MQLLQPFSITAKQWQFVLHIYGNKAQSLSSLRISSFPPPIYLVKMPDYLPPEILVGILTRVPPKSIIRFRCVSKSWNLMLLSPRFISMHREQSFTSKSNATSHKLMVRYYLKEKESDIYSVHSDDETFNVGEILKIKYPRRSYVSYTRWFYRVVGCYNGVLCLSDNLFGEYYDTILLWNPSIRRKVTLPLAPSLLLLKRIKDYEVILGFGFDVKNKDYKVVRITYVREESCYLVGRPTVEIYMLSAGSWREIDVQAPSNFRLYDWPQAFVNGNVHWVVQKITGEDRDTSENWIMVFSMTDEVFDEMQLPHALSNIHIAVFEEALAVFQHASGHCLIWVMEEYGIPKSWQKKIDIDLTDLYLIDESVRVLRFRKNSHVLVLLTNHKSLISYDPKTGTRKDLGINGALLSFFVDDYAESLALLIEGEPVRGRIPSDNNNEFLYL